MKKALGIDVGATGIKGAPVDLEKGVLLQKRHKISTPDGGKVDDILQVVTELVNFFGWKGKPIGIGFPSVIKGGKSLTASNIDKDWINYPIVDKLSELLGVEAPVLNDADAAGQAELGYGKGKGVAGTVILLTLGTGIGSAVFKDGELLPNTELGQINFKGKIAEKVVSNSARKRRDLSWEEYGKALGDYLRYVNGLFYPNLIILGGGISKKFDLFSDGFNDLAHVVPAALKNDAGILGAAFAAKNNKAKTIHL